MRLSEIEASDLLVLSHPSPHHSVQSPVPIRAITIQLIVWTSTCPNIRTHHYPGFLLFMWVHGPVAGCWRQCTLNQQGIFMLIWILQLLPFRFQHRNQDKVHSMKMLFDEMKFFHLDVTALAPCAMRPVERDYDQLSFYPGLEELCHCCHWCGHEELCPRQIRPDSRLLSCGRASG